MKKKTAARRFELDFVKYNCAEANLSGILPRNPFEARHVNFMDMFGHSTLVCTNYEGKHSCTVRLLKPLLARMVGWRGLKKCQEARRVG